jgi:polar amino acid transport system substrate-binding protein
VRGTATRDRALRAGFGPARSPSARCGLTGAALAAALSLTIFAPCLAPCAAQPAAQGAVVSGPAAAPPSPVVPRFFDPARRLARPDLAGRALRILTDDDYPPFGFVGTDGTLSGFNVDLARALCETLELSCTIQARRFDTLVESLAQNEGDAVVASLARSPALAEKVEFTLPYYRTPARFVTRADAALTGASPAELAGRTVGVELRTAHEDYLRVFFPGVAIRTFVTQAAARAALRAGEIDALFGDGVSQAIWLAGAEAQGCCRFVGGPYTESRWFGDGVAIAVRKGDAHLRRGLDWALHRLAQNGRYSELYLKYFPVGFY